MTLIVEKQSRSWLNDIIIPILLFSSMGAYGWAVRGTAGYGTIRGCVLVGSILAALWMFLSRESSMVKSRRYNSAWTPLALIFGIGIGGSRGWAFWPQWVNGIFYPYEYDPSFGLPIDPTFGYIWVFIGASAWAGFGAVLLAWTGSKSKLNLKDWILRLGLGFGFGLIAYLIFNALPNVFLPLYDQLAYDNYSICTECRDAYNHNIVAFVFFMMMIGFLLFEIIKKDWQNVKLILIVSSVTGFGWMILLGNQIDLIWWRVFEGSAGLFLGLSYGIAFVVCNSPLPSNHKLQRDQPYTNHPSLAVWLGTFFAFGFGLTWSIHQAVQGYSQIHLGIETPMVNLPVLIPALIVFAFVLILQVVYLRKMQFLPGEARDNNPKIVLVCLVVYLLIRMCGLLVTGPLSEPWEMGFEKFYLIQMVIELFLGFYLWSSMQNQK